MSRRNFLPALLVTVVTAVSPLSAPSAAERLKTIEPGQLTYGVAATFTPFEYTKDGTLVGFDIDLIAALAKRMGLAPDARSMQFNGLIPALQGGRIDLINSAMYITPSRAEQVDFVPYLRLGNRIIVQADNPAKITGRDDSICGKTVAVTLGGIQESYARADAQRCTAAGHAQLTIQTLPTAQDAALGLRQGRVDAIYDSTPGTVKLMDEVPGVYAAVGLEFEATTQIGIAVGKGDQAMADAVHRALAEIVADGTYKQLIDKWKLPPTVSLFD